MGLCFPGIKTPKLDGVSIMANGPRNIKMLSMINHKIKTNNHTKLMMREIYDDSECCLIGEWKSSIGKLQNSENAIYIGGGTGIADGIILGNKIVDIRNSKKIKRSILSDDDNPISKLIFQRNLTIPIEISTHRNTAALGAAYKAYDNHK